MSSGINETTLNSTEKRLVVYPGTFDPFHNGHLDIVRRASASFDNVLVAVAASSSKKTLFSADERKEMIKKATSDLNNVDVASFDGLLVRFIKNSGASRILRGMRAVTDFEYEFQMALANRSIEPEIETLFMVTSPEFAYMTASMVKEIWKLGGDVSAMVPDSSLSMLDTKK